MDPSIVTGFAAVLGSLAGASAAVATTWMTERSRTLRERAQLETSKREALYGDFITEASRLIADAFDHTLDRPETLVALFSAVARIRLMASGPVLEAAQDCCDHIVELYTRPNHRVDELLSALRSGELGFMRAFSDACRKELQRYSVR